MSVSRNLRLMAGFTLALGLVAPAASIAFAQSPAVPQWSAPEGFEDGAKASGKGAGKANRNAERGARKAAGPSGNLGSPMRQIDRDDIDMSGVGREVRSYGSGVKPMMNGGSMGVGGGF